MSQVIKLNQYQSYYDLDKKQGIILDFLYATIAIVEKKDNEFNIQNIYSSDYKKVEKSFADRLNKINNTSLEFVIIPSYSCNMTCIYCYEGEKKNTKSFFDEQDVEPLIESIGNIISKEQTKKLFSPNCSDFDRIFSMYLKYKLTIKN